MTDIQKILKAVSSHTITADTCERLIRALDTIPDYHHADFLLAFFHDEPEPEALPEDYLAVKTFGSREFHIGDEVAYGSERYVVYRFDEERAFVFGDGPVSCIRREESSYTRTGRNFPAVPAILQELKKGVDKSAQEG